MIGLDGATFYLLDHLMAEGVMPFLKGFLEKSVRGDLMSTRNPLTPPAWISMVTGRSPHVHGIYDFLKPTTLADGSVFLKINDSREIKAETVWSMVSRQGLRATTLNFYGMAPAFEINGYLASGFVPWKYLRKGMHPASLFDLVRLDSGKIKLNWTAPVNNGGSAVTNYRVYQSTDNVHFGLVTSGGCENLTTTTTCTRTGLTQGVTYHFKVSAVNVVGEGPKSATASAGG